MNASLFGIVTLEVYRNIAIERFRVIGMRKKWHKVINNSSVNGFVCVHKNEVNGIRLFSILFYIIYLC